MSDTVTVVCLMCVSSDVCRCVYHGDWGAAKWNGCRRSQSPSRRASGPRQMTAPTACEARLTQLKRVLDAVDVRLVAQPTLINQMHP